MTTGTDTADDLPPRAHEQVLADAVRVLTEAARLTRPTLERVTDSADDARSEWVESGRRELADWAEFVTLALAGAAANVGGIDVALAGRPGSWEADGVRTLLTSTVGHDEAHLLEHRTEPVVVQVYVDEILVDLEVWKAYDDATRELVRHYEAIGIPSATTAGAAAELEPATEEQERQAEAIGVLEDRLEDQRLQDWAEYGRTLAANIEAAAARRAGLRVPVVVHVDLAAFRSPPPEPAWDLSEQLLHEGIDATPVPGSGRAPLERLGDADEGPAGAGA